MCFLATWVYPELRGIPPAERDEARRRARRTPFDVIELIGTAAAVVATTAITRTITDSLGVGDRTSYVAANFAVAIPLLAVFMAPLHVRRTRRGLRSTAARDEA